MHDQIARVCVDGSAKFSKFLIPTIARQLEVNGPIERATTAVASWARYLAVVDPADQAFDSNADVARRHAADAVADPVAFLKFDEHVRNRYGAAAEADALHLLVVTEHAFGYGSFVTNLTCDELQLADAAPAAPTADAVSEAGTSESGEHRLPGGGGDADPVG